MSVDNHLACNNSVIRSNMSQTDLKKTHFNDGFFPGRMKENGEGRS